jgi:hypothetical protein
MEGVKHVIFVVIPKTSLGKKRPDNFIYLFFSLQIYCRQPFQTEVLEKRRVTSVRNSNDSRILQAFVSTRYVSLNHTYLIIKDSCFTVTRDNVGGWGGKGESGMIISVNSYFVEHCEINGTS